ncbi:MAG: class I mannose-6-phosphate isomerase [Clostridia bacterium]|nr:class I mannose-6-phosphate isomerase [Clostridia bacterium]
MYPLILEPPVKDYLWGGTKLKSDFNLKTDKEKAAEGWMLSCHKDGESVIQNGELSGKTLSFAIELWGAAALGEKAASFSAFPILIKLIDAKQKLSVQVHPDDEYALRVEGEFGKNEMWYVVDCEEGSSLIYGFNKTLGKEEFERRIRANTLEDVCNFVPVKKGDVFFISAGTLHAIGEGILIAEVQQSSNSTYRVSDYGRLGADGKPRPLHIEKALDVTKTTPPTLPYGAVGDVAEFEYGSERELASCEFFSAKILNLCGTKEISYPDSFISLVVLDGEFTLSFGKEKILCKKGQSIFIPAGLCASISGTAEILYSYI